MERIYLDTSVFGGYFEPEFELWTKILFDKIQQGEYKLLFSRVTDIELTKAPQHVRDLVVSIPNDYVEFIETTDDATELADNYIKENVVGETSRADCLHIALATLNNADILVSWNFKHIVNVHRIRGYNAVNYRHGYKMLEIRTPREILEL
ncbi:MAG: PIN domain-containing protein [Bacteroidetes bacterium]|nr:PIN domain-containing protein [Bacteroidota bacterium]